MDIRHLHPTYDIAVAAQKARADANKKAQKPDGGDDGGHVNDPMDGGVPGGIDPPE